jgi:hypothetical protein
MSLHTEIPLQVDAKYFEEMRFYRSHLSAYINFGFAADPADTRKWSKKLKDEGPQAAVSMGVHVSDFVCLVSLSLSP